ncbi:DNA sulfur modification protein DndB [Mycobacterium neumannii]|uniref:DNA sulfur modification protein DndB n=1 Tax=Mycobacterium neumannii TaxID=2048551 RepID=UPI003AB34620
MTAVRVEPSASDPQERTRSSGYEYVFPAIRGIQAGREYYVTMCPLRLIPRLFLFDEEELPPEMRAQRTLNKARVPEISRYIVENPDTYIFSALTASVNAEVQFDPMTGGVNGPGERVGTLTIPMSARFVINDGQHRRAAIQHALAENPDLGDESIAIVLFLDVGLSRCQQMFADLNRYAIRPSKSIGVLYDHRDEMSAITKLVVMRSPFFSDLTETETSNLSARSRKLFTLSALYSANKALLEGVELGTFERQVDVASRFWMLVADQFPEWHQVRSRDVSSGEVRRDFIHSHGVVLQSIGKIGNALIRQSQDEKVWEKTLSKLANIDWHRANASTWEGRATVGGKVSKGAANVLLTAGYIRSILGLELPPDEQQAEDGFIRSGR